MGLEEDVDDEDDDDAACPVPESTASSSPKSGLLLLYALLLLSLLLLFMFVVALFSGSEIVVCSNSLLSSLVGVGELMVAGGVVGVGVARDSVFVGVAVVVVGMGVSAVVVVEDVGVDVLESGSVVACGGDNGDSLGNPSADAGTPRSPLNNTLVLTTQNDKTTRGNNKQTYLLQKEEGWQSCLLVVKTEQSTPPWE